MEEKTLRDKLEEWLKNRPKMMTLEPVVTVERFTKQVNVKGKITPELMEGGYNIKIELWSPRWEEILEKKKLEISKGLKGGR